MKKELYTYPAILTYEEGYEISVTFPDFIGCATSGKTDGDAIDCAKEALGLHLWGMETDGEVIPPPTPLKAIVTHENEVVALIDVYMPSIRLAQNNRCVNRTVTIPAWLNAKALEHGVDFSQLLQESLMKVCRVTK